MARPVSLYGALNSRDAKLSFRLVRSTARDCAGHVVSLMGLPPGFRAVVLGRTIEALANSLRGDELRRAVTLAHAALRTIDRRRGPPAGRIRPGRACHKPRLP